MPKGEKMPTESDMIEDETENPRLAELMELIRQEKAASLKARKAATARNKNKVHLTTCTKRNDSNDTYRIVDWTPEYNKGFRSLPRLIGDRDPNVDKILGLYYRVKVGRLPFVWATAFCNETKLTYRINGNNSSAIAAKLPDAYKGATVFEIRFVAETLDEIRFIHSQFDAPFSSRTPSDVLKTWTASFGIQLGDKLVSPLLNAIEMARTARKIRGGDTVPYKVGMMVKDINFLRWMHNNVFPNRVPETAPFCRICFLVGVYMLYHIPGRRTKVKEFLSKVVFPNANEYHPSDPCLLLHQKILRTPAPTSDATFPEFMQQLGWFIMAWNAYINDQRPHDFKIPTGKPLPVPDGMSPEAYSQFDLLQRIYLSPKGKRTANRHTA